MGGFFIILGIVLVLMFICAVVYFFILKASDSVSENRKRHNAVTKEEDLMDRFK